MTHSGEVPPFRIMLRGESVTLTDAEANEIVRDLLQQSAARTEAEEAAAREAGQVWCAITSRYGRREEEEYFALRDAAEALETGEEMGTLYAEGIRCPDGTVYTKKDLADGYTWRTLPALQAEGSAT